MYCKIRRKLYHVLYMKSSPLEAVIAKKHQTIQQKNSHKVHFENNNSKHGDHDLLLMGAIQAHPISSQKILILLDIRSAQNVGSLFRTADAVGIDHIYLCGVTPQPIDRFGRKDMRIHKTALGAEDCIPWEYREDCIGLLRELTTKHYQTIAIEQSKNSIDYKTIHIQPYTAFILGNEVDGIPQNILDVVTDIVEIPMKGMKESLNVSVAGGIALFRMLDR